MPSESPRIAELRRRVEADPSSIAFAQLAEEYRRAGNFQSAEQVCRTGLTRHPSYLSARVTLGRTLIELDKLDEAESELNFVLKSAPDNLAAIRGMAEIHQRRGHLELSLDFYRRALPLARHDPEIEENVRKINQDLSARKPKDDPGLSFKEAQAEFLNALNQLPAVQPPAAAPAPPAAPSTTTPTKSVPIAPTPKAAVAAAVPPPESIDMSVEPAAVGPAIPDADNTSIDFDSLLKSLGVPDHQPPPAVEALLTEPAEPAARPEPVLPDLPLNVEPDDAFAELERGLRDFDSSSSLAQREEPTATTSESLGYGEFSFRTAPAYEQAPPEPAVPYGERFFEETPAALTQEPIREVEAQPEPAFAAVRAAEPIQVPEPVAVAPLGTEEYVLQELEAWLAAIKR